MSHWRLPAPATARQDLARARRRQRYRAHSPHLPRHAKGLALRPRPARAQSRPVHAPLFRRGISGLHRRWPRLRAESRPDHPGRRSTGGQGARRAAAHPGGQWVGSRYRRPRNTGDFAMITARINQIEVQVPEGTSILDAARQVQVKIPTLCKHKDLLATASCGICIVRNKGGNKMIRACCTPLETGMEITTHDREIVDVRRATLELILSNHPQACLNCGRNGECELQTLAADFNIPMESIKRYVKDVPPDTSTGSIIIDFTKCIKCGRCVQVCQEVQNVWALSFLDRGINTRMAPAGDI